MSGEFFARPLFLRHLPIFNGERPQRAISVIIHVLVRHKGPSHILRAQLLEHFAQRVAQSKSPSYRHLDEAFHSG